MSKSQQWPKKQPQKNFDRSNFKKAERRRTVLSGYPIETRFTTPEEINEYFSGYYVECLLCGRKLISLGQHLSKMHTMSDIEYKIKYGLPMMRGLTCSHLHSKLSSIQKEIYKEGKNPLSKESIRISGSKKAASLGHKKTVQPFHGTIRSRRINTWNKKWSTNDIERVINRAKKEKRTIRDVCRDRDMPSYSVFYFLKKDRRL